MMAYMDCKLIFNAAPQVKLYETCGGRSSLAGINAPDPEFCCPEGSLCKFYNEDFWQCQPRGYAAPPEPPTTHDEAACTGKTKANKWAACGGLTAFGANASSPSVCCPTGFACKMYDPFFWQCQPESYQVKQKPRGTWEESCKGDKVGACLRWRGCFVRPVGLFL
jgi:hypothetical protein